MTETAGLSEVEVEPQFDVFIRVPPHEQVDLLAGRLRSVLGMDELKVQSIVNRLRSMPVIQIGAKVSKGAADKAASDFKRVGFNVELQPVLALQIKAQVGKRPYECPSCEAETVLTAQRQCSQCGVYVDKLTEEFLLHKKISKEERRRAETLAAKDVEARARNAKNRAEALLRDKIRKELEEELGIKKVKISIFSGRAGLVRAGGVLLLIGGAFAGGMGASSLLYRSGRGSEPQLAHGISQVDDIEKLLMTSPSINKKLDEPSSAKADELGEPAVDMTSDESLINIAEQGRGKGEGLTVAQAVAASQKLAKPLVSRAEQTKVQQQENPENRSAVRNATVHAEIPVKLKPMLQAVLARILAELGHVQRAHEVIKTAYKAPMAVRGVDGTIQLKLADIEVEAFSLLGASESRVKSQLDVIVKNVAELPSPYWRALALARLGSILGSSPRPLVANALPYFQQANETAKQIAPIEQRDAAMGDLIVSMARLQLESATQYASKGLWSHARERVNESEAIHKQFVNGRTQSRLAAVEYQSQYLLGSHEHATEILQNAMINTEKLGLIEKLQALRVWAVVLHVSDSAAFQKLLILTQAQVEALQAGPEKMQVIGELALIHADAGKSDIFETLRSRAALITGVPPEAAVEINARLGVMGILALARNASKRGNFAAVEGYVRVVAKQLMN